MSLTPTITPFRSAFDQDAVPVYSLRQDVEVILGMPRYDCRFHGICKLKLAGTAGRRGRYEGTGDTVRGSLSWRPDGLSCQLSFPAGQLSEARTAYHFDRQYMDVSDPVCVAALLRLPGIETPHLLPGRYPLTYAAGRYYCELALGDTATPTT